jgi:predicted hotdog family 3-hydroxylacyl-ACP dehydratase
MNSGENVLLFIPQRPPFIMVGELLFADGKVTRTTFLIKEDNCLVNNGSFLEAGLLENMAQTAAAGSGYKSVTEQKAIPMGYLAGVKNLEIFSLPKINEELITEVTIENRIFNINVVRGKVWCNTKLIAQCEMRLFIDYETNSA